MKARLLPVVIIPLLVLVFSAWAVAGTAPGKPKLVLQVTIDQMRGDFPMRYKDRLGEGGFLLPTASDNALDNWLKAKSLESSWTPIFHKKSLGIALTLEYKNVNFI